MTQERTLVLVKPDAIQRGLTGEVLRRLEMRGLKLVGLKLVHMPHEMAERHYAAHTGKPFFASLVDFITSGPLLAVALEGPKAIQTVRNTMGATDPAEAAPGTIRGDLAVDIGRNLVHGSDSAASAEQELAIFFDSDELVSYDRATDPWIVE